MSIAQDIKHVNGESWGGAPQLADHPILVCTLQNDYFLLDLNTDEPMWPIDYIPFQSEPTCSDRRPMAEWETYGLEAVA